MVPSQIRSSFDARCILFSGLPGSGKNTFAKKLVERILELKYEVLHLNQDAIGGREAFEKALEVGTKMIKRLNKIFLIVDRCNARNIDLINILKLLHNPEADQVVLIHFDIREKLCLQRIEQRFIHFTLNP